MMGRGTDVRFPSPAMVLIMHRPKTYASAVQYVGRSSRSHQTQGEYVFHLLKDGTKKGREADLSGSEKKARLEHMQL